MSTAEEYVMPDANRLYIGEGVTVKGEISVSDTLVVCGVVEGDVSVGNLVVGESGSIKGRITVAQNAEISGKVFEKLDVRCLLILRATGRVDGNISYGLLQIEQGASIAGGLTSVASRSEQKPAPAKVDFSTRLDPRPLKPEAPRQEPPKQDPSPASAAKPAKPPVLSAVDALPSNTPPAAR